MKLPKVCIHLVIFFISIFSNQSIASDSDTLKSLFVVFRHGARAPIAIYDNNPYGESAWPNGLGELTDRGKWQLERVGQFLRSNYSHFLSGSVDEVDIRSTDSPRLIESAESAWKGFKSKDDTCNGTQVLPIRVDQVSFNSHFSICQIASQPIG